MESLGPVVVCLDGECDGASLVRCGAALARVSDVTLCLAFLILLPIQRPLGILSGEDERRANAVLDLAADQAASLGVVATEEICIARSRVGAIQQIAEDMKASTVVVGWHGTGPFEIFDAGRSLLKAVPCPVVMVGSTMVRQAKRSWPPRWLSESHTG